MLLIRAASLYLDDYRAVYNVASVNEKPLQPFGVRRGSYWV